MTPFEARLTNLFEPSLHGLGYQLVRVQLRGDMRKTLQIMVERLDLRGMTLNDCETVSQTLSALLDVHDPIKERYALEVSSPGIDRPLMRPADFQRYIGFEAKIDFRDLHEGRRQVKGEIKHADEASVQIQLETGGVFTAPYVVIQRAKLVLTDALIDAHLKVQQEIETINQTPVSVDAGPSNEE